MSPEAGCTWGRRRSDWPISCEGAEDLHLMQYLRPSGDYPGEAFFGISKSCLCATLEDVGFSVERAELGGADRVFVIAQSR